MAPEINIELKDQYGNTHKLSDYNNKTIFLNFSSMLCPPCIAELPDIKKLYESYGKNEKDTAIIMVMSNLQSANPYGASGLTIDKIKEFIKQNNIEFPVLLDTEGKLFSSYGIRAFPTTFTIKNGAIENRVLGQMPYKNMENLINNSK